MPIFGLTTQDEAIFEAGRLRLGPPKNSEGGGLSELGYFRRDFRPGQESASLTFARLFGEKPTEFTARLPFKQASKNFDAYYRVYNTSGQIGKADGVKWLYLRDNKTDEVIVNDGRPIRPGNYPLDDDGLPYMPFDKTIPVYSYYSQKKKMDIPVYARATGMLNVYVPGVGGLVIVLHGIHSIVRISRQMADIEQKSIDTHIPMSMIPVIVSLNLENVPVTVDGKRSRADHYILNIRISPEWLEAYDSAVSGLLPGGAKPAAASLGSVNTLALPENVTAEELSEVEEEAAIKIIPATQPTKAAEPQPDAFTTLATALYASQAATKSAAVLKHCGTKDAAIKFMTARMKAIENATAMAEHIKINWPGFESLVSLAEGVPVGAMIRGVDHLAALQAENPEALKDMDNAALLAVLQSFAA